jgi:hypothetical protein
MKIARLFDYMKRRATQFDDMYRRVERIQEALGRIEGRQLSDRWHGDFRAVEFRAFSQWGEDGILQALLRVVPVKQKVFVEFGVENYTESNTRFLLGFNNWAGLVIDGSPENITQIKRDPIYWQHNLKAECAFITAENINEVISHSGVVGDIGILSIDIDGNDYWIWKAINVVNPAIVVVEYNARFGADRACTIPYDPGFHRADAHYSMIYYGASLAALTDLGRSKGYALVGCNTAGNNAFFVRRDLLVSPLVEKSPAEAYNANQFRESRNQEGGLAFLSAEQERELVFGLPLVDVEAAVA